MGVTQRIRVDSVHEIAVPIHADGQVAVISLQAELALATDRLDDRGRLQRDDRSGRTPAQKQRGEQDQNRMASLVLIQGS